MDEQKSQQPQPDETPSDEKKESAEGKGWIEKLAHKSAGLPDVQKPGPSTTDKEKDKDKSSPWKYAGIGLQFAGTVGVMAYFGYVIDQWQGWQNNQALIAAVVIGVIGGMYLLIKESMKANK